MRLLTFFVVFLKKKKKERKKEREKESCGLWLVVCLIEREGKRKLISCQESRLTSQGNCLFTFWVCLAMYLLNLHWQQQGRLTKREKVRESPFINDKDNLIFQILLSLLHERCIFITIIYEILFIYWFILFRLWNLFILDFKKNILYKIPPSLLRGGR